MSGLASNIVITPVNMFWRIESQWKVDFVNVTAAGFGGTSFTWFSAKDATQFYAWGDENSLDVDPSATGTSVEIDYAAAASSTVIAAAFQVAVDGLGAFSATVSGTVVTVTNAAVGSSTEVVNTDVPNIILTTCYIGKDFELGLLEGEPTPSLEFDNFVVTSQQNGITPLSEINRGVVPSVETVIQESTRSKLDTLISIYGGKFTPGGGTEVFGIGTGAIGKNMQTEAARLEFIAVNTINSELTYQINFMLAIPQTNSILISGENPRTFTVAWSAFPNLELDDRVNTVLIGDPNQTL